MIKFWPDKDKHGVEVVLEVGGARIVTFLDLEEAYEAIDDFTGALTILEQDWVDKL